LTDAEAFNLLGIPPTASEAEIRSAYRVKVREAHPDLGGHADLSRVLEARRVLELSRTERVKCPRCHGKGSYRRFTGFYTLTVACDLCGGSGKKDS
jgi:DnaJ-class molecular chaperone